MSEIEQKYRLMVMKTGQEKPHARSPPAGTEEEREFDEQMPWARAKAGGKMKKGGDDDDDDDDDDGDYEELF
jgi:hypothetical protein